MNVDIYFNLNDMINTLSKFDLCLKLAECHYEEDIIKLLKKVWYWDDDSAWDYIGWDENNASVIWNQQSDWDRALVEKITNSVDALLMRECLKRKINPSGSLAPKNIKEAVEKFFNVEKWSLSNLSTMKRWELSTNINIVATWSKTTPTYTIVDVWEWQHPSAFTETILSTRKANKNRIPFVQGKFNMGWTWVLKHCWENKIELIISRRYPDIMEGVDHDWGFTVTRRISIPGLKNPVYKYLAPKGQILSFSKNEWLPIFPTKDGDHGIFKWGMYIKLFEYNIWKGKWSNMSGNWWLRDRLDFLLPNTWLPIRLYERRYKSVSGSWFFESIVSWLSIRLELDKSEKLEDWFWGIGGEMVVDGQKIPYKIYVYQAWKNENKEGVIFTVNWQTHGDLSQQFYDRKSVGLQPLRKEIITILDCSGLSMELRADLFMSSRDRLGDCRFRQDIESKLEEILKNHEGLNTLKQKRFEEGLQERLQDAKPLIETIEKILNKSPVLSRLLLAGNQIQNPVSKNKPWLQQSFVWKKFPTTFSSRIKYNQWKPKEIHFWSKFRIDFITDAQNDYFSRENDHWEIQLFINDTPSKNFFCNLWNGFAHLNVSIDDSLMHIGEEIRCRTEVMDPSRTNPFIEEFYCKVVESVPLNPNPLPGHRRKQGETDKGNDWENIQKLWIPEPIRIKEEDWYKYNFDKKSALKIEDFWESGYRYLINVDNVDLLTEIKYSKIDGRIIEEKYVIALILIGMALLSEQKEWEDIYSNIEQVTKLLSPVILPLTSILAEDI